MKIKILFITFFTITSVMSAQNFVHPGITHKLSDLDRMKAMVEAGVEPYATSFLNLSNHRRAKSDYSTSVATDAPTSLTEYPGINRNWFINDGTAAYYNALMWYITEDVAHANKAIELLNTYSGITKVTGIPLEAGRVWRIIEAAEIIAHTYHEDDYANGWSATNIQAFKDMLVYPGYSTTTIPTGDASFYWKIHNGDVNRHGNQGLFAYRTMMAIAIFTDNQTMYDRVLQYLKGLDLSTGDIPFPTGPVTQANEITACDYFDEYANKSTFGNVPNYHGNEAIENYIFDNGQSQESSRDQAHAVAGVSTIAVISEMAWNQGDDLYGFLDNRPLLGLEFFYRYNLSFTVQGEYPDQLTPWEPTVASGEYIVRTDRSGRWTSRKINPGVNCDADNLTRGEQNLEPIYEMNLGHYRDRMNLPSNDYKWLERGHAYLTSQVGVEGEGTVTDHPGYGGLKFRRVTPGDPISGFDTNGLPAYKMNELPMTIEAENYDYFVLNGEGKTYSDMSSTNDGGEYRNDENVDLKANSEGGYSITNIQDGEWLTYTINVPNDGNYDIDINYASANANGNIKFNFGGDDITSEVVVPFGGANSTGITDWQELKVGSNINLNKGVQVMKVLFSGSNDAFELNNITISLVAADPDPINLAVLYGTATQSTDRPSDGFAPLAIDGNTNGVYGNESVTHTGANAGIDPEPWWQVDLENNYNIETIDVYGRTDCCSDRLSDFTVQVLDSNENETFSQFYTSAPSNSFTVITGGVVGSVVKISKTSTTALSLAEVEIYGIDRTVSLSNPSIISNNQIKIHPNPTNNNFIITNSRDAIIKIYDMTGKLMMQSNINSDNQPIDISNFNNGVYLAKIDNNGYVISRKIIKK